MSQRRGKLELERIRIVKKLSVLLARSVPAYFAGRLRNPVFVIGYGQSGKSLLAGLLGLHRDAAHWREANDVWDPKGYPWRTSKHETPPIWADPVAFTARWWRDAQNCQTKIRATFGAYQWLRHRPCFLNDTPLNTFRIPYLLSMFPEARFIHMVRDGREAVWLCASKEHRVMQAYPAPYQEMGLVYSFEELLKALAAFWTASLQEVARQDEALQLGQRGVLLELTYEELCADTFSALQQVCQYAELDPARFAPAVKEQKLDKRPPEWEKCVDPALAAQLISLMRPMLVRKGYM